MGGKMEEIIIYWSFDLIIGILIGFFTAIGLYWFLYFILINKD